jgi:hypothetical protein
MGLTEEQIETIVSEHAETVDGLKGEIARYKQEAQQAQEAKEPAPNPQESEWKTKAEDWESKYNALLEENKNKATHEAKEKAYRDLLKEIGVSEKRLNSVLRVSDIDALNLVDGKLVDADALANTAKAEWADFIVQESTSGANTQTPPATNPARTYTADDIRKMTPAEINQNWDAIKTSLKNN